MRYSFAAAALAAASITTGVNGVAMPQASSSSSGCQTSFSGSFQIKVVTESTPATSSALATPRMKKRAQVLRTDGTLVATLQDGTLTDAKGRIGSIVSNHQFQFDPAPGQVNALATSGFSICNNKLALKDSTNFFQCRSGDFFNLYDESIAPQCEPITIDILSCDSGADNSGAVIQLGDGQTQNGGGSVAQIGDGQLQSPAGQQGGSVGEIGEGQLQNPSAGGSGSQPGGSSGGGSGAQQPAGGGSGAQQGGSVGEIGDGQLQNPGAGGSGSQTGGSNGGSSGSQPPAGGEGGGGGSTSGGGSNGGTPSCASCSSGSQPSGNGAGGGGGTSGGQQPFGNGAGGPAEQLGDGQVQSGGQSGGGGGGAANEAGDGQLQSPARF